MKMNRREALQFGAGALVTVGALAGGVAGLDAVVEHADKAREKIEMEGKIAQKDEVIVIGKYSKERTEQTGGTWTPGYGTAFFGGLLYGTPGAIIGGQIGASRSEPAIRPVDQPYILVRFPDGKSKEIAVSLDTFNNLKEQDRLEMEYIVDEKTKELTRVKSLKKLDK
jgi:hypothetical protein